MCRLERLRARREKKEAIVQKARAEAADIAKEERIEAARRANEDRATERRTETQRLCTLGRAFMSLYARSESNANLMQRHLNVYITRDVDRDILRGTPWQVPESQQHSEEPVYTQHEQHHE